MNQDTDIINSVVAVIEGQPLTTIPSDLFIPPDALEILLESFSGPLDLLLYLIRRDNIDIMDIPMVLITKQYMHYIDLMESTRMELAADYLVMAATLIEIKARLLLPVIVTSEDELVEDPRMELVRRLQRYEQFKQAAVFIDTLPRLDRDVFRVQVSSNVCVKPIEPEVSLESLTMAMVILNDKKSQLIHHQINREPLSVNERIAMVFKRLENGKLLALTDLFEHHEGRMGLVVSLLAILELAKQSLIVVMQRALFAPIYLKSAA